MKKNLLLLPAISILLILLTGCHKDPPIPDIIIEPPMSASISLRDTATGNEVGEEITLYKPYDVVIEYSVPVATEQIKNKLFLLSKNKSDSLTYPANRAFDAVKDTIHFDASDQKRTFRYRVQPHLLGPHRLEFQIKGASSVSEYVDSVELVATFDVVKAPPFDAKIELLKQTSKDKVTNGYVYKDDNYIIRITYTTPFTTDRNKNSLYLNQNNGSHNISYMGNPGAAFTESEPIPFDASQSEQVFEFLFTPTAKGAQFFSFVIESSLGEKKVLDLALNALERSNPIGTSVSIITPYQYVKPGRDGWNIRAQFKLNVSYNVAALKEVFTPEELNAGIRYSIESSFAQNGRTLHNVVSFDKELFYKTGQEENTTLTGRFNVSSEFEEGIKEIWIAIRDPDPTHEPKKVKVTLSYLTNPPFRVWGWPTGDDYSNTAKIVLNPSYPQSSKIRFEVKENGMQEDIWVNNRGNPDHYIKVSTFKHFFKPQFHIFGYGDKGYRNAWMQADGYSDYIFADITRQYDAQNREYHCNFTYWFFAHGNPPKYHAYSPGKQLKIMQNLAIRDMHGYQAYLNGVALWWRQCKQGLLCY